MLHSIKLAPLDPEIILTLPPATEQVLHFGLPAYLRMVDVDSLQGRIEEEGSPPREIIKDPVKLERRNLCSTTPHARITPLMTVTAFPRSFARPAARSQKISRSPPRALTCLARNESVPGRRSFAGSRARAGVPSQ